MSEIYSSLNLSPKKKRAAANFDADTLTPKKLRLAFVFSVLYLYRMLTLDTIDPQLLPLRSSVKILLNHWFLI